MSKRFKELIDQSPEGQIKYTCPAIDTAIVQLEELRESNTQLRDSALYWESRCKEVCDELDELTKPTKKKHKRSTRREFNK